MNQDIVAILLAAGEGRRLFEVTGGRPKALARVGDQTLVDRALKFIERLGVANTVIVVGAHAESVTAEVYKQSSDHLAIVRNSDFQAGSSLSLATALAFVNSSFLIFNVDHIFPFRFAELLTRSLPNLNHTTAFVDRKRLLLDDDMKISLRNGVIASIAKALSAYDCGYIGVTFVPETERQHYVKALDHVIRTTTGSASVEVVLQQLVNQAIAVHVMDVGDMTWFEVDTPEDYRRVQAAMQTGWKA